MPPCRHSFSEQLTAWQKASTRANAFQLSENEPVACELPKIGGMRVGEVWSRRITTFVVAIREAGTGRPQGDTTRLWLY